MEKMKTVRRVLYYKLLEEAEEKLRNGIHTDSYVENLLRGQKELGISRDEIAYVPGFGVLT